MIEHLHPALSPAQARTIRGRASRILRNMFRTRYLATGRSVSDVAQTMVIDEADVTSAALGVSIGETPEAVRLRIQPSEDVEVGSVEVRFEDHAAVVVASDSKGRPIRSRSLRLPEPVIEEGVSAEYDADGTLVVMLRKRSAAGDAGSPSGH